MSENQTIPQKIGDQLDDEDDGETESVPSGYLLIENGEKLKQEIKQLQNDLYEQAVLFCRELDCLWRLIKDFMRLAGPVLICLVSLLLTRFIFCRKYQPMILSSLLGCAVATILVYSTPFIMSFQRYRRVRHERVRKVAAIVNSSLGLVKTDSETQTSESDSRTSQSSSDTDVETLANPPSSSTSSSSTEGSSSSESNPSIEVIGAAEVKYHDGKSKTCLDCGDNQLATCNCCLPK